MQVSVVIPTYRRGEVLLDTIRYLLELPTSPKEILIVDQTEGHPPEILSGLQKLEKRIVRRMVLPEPSITRAMNVGLREAKGEIVLFLDDDIIPDEILVAVHLKAHEQFPEAWAVVGQVLQPGEEAKDEDQLALQRSANKAGGSEARFPKTGGRWQKSEGSLRRDLDFLFNSNEPAWIENVMAGNLSVKKEFALHAGGFDENFIPPVSYRFETEFAKRIIKAGGKICFEPSASIKHLRAGQGGTRSLGSHLTSASPIHGVGDYYYALRCGQGTERIGYMLKRPFCEICTKFHLRHPWFVPVKLAGELRALRMAIRLNNSGSRLLSEWGRSA